MTLSASFRLRMTVWIVPFAALALTGQADDAEAALWTETLKEGRALRDRFGSRVGGDYSSREDKGVFWSNDAAMSMGSMIRELGLREMPTEIERVDAARIEALQK